MICPFHGSPLGKSISSTVFLSESVRPVWKCSLSLAGSSSLHRLVWNIMLDFFNFPLMNWFLYFVTRFFYLFFWYFLQIISISIFVGQGICKIVVAELFLVCKGNRKRRVSFCHNFKSSENVNYCRWFDKNI